MQTSSSYKVRLACTNSFTAVNYYTEQILWSCPALKILWVCNFAQLILCPVMSFILLLHSLYSLNAVVCGKKGKMQTPTLTASTPSSGKSILISRDFLCCVSSCSSLIVIQHFLAERRQPYRTAWPVCSGMLFHVWSVITFLPIGWNKYLLLQ